jgi:hypothetical protein
VSAVFLPLCLRVPFSRPESGFLHFWMPISHAGALKATKNGGIHLAVDHLSANEENPVPDLSSVTSTTSSARPPQSGGDPMDEDDDLEALKAVYGTGGSGSDPGEIEAGAKVC